MKEWSLYILRCSDGSLYTGISTDVQRRYREHLSGKGKAARYTRSYASLELVYHILVGERSLAMRLERRVKGLSKTKKELIVASGFNRDELVQFLKLGESN